MVAGLEAHVRERRLLKADLILARNALRATEETFLILPLLTGSPFVVV